MKQFTLLTLVVALFAVSCSNKNGAFTKRKYTKGQYIAHAGKASQPKVNQGKTNSLALVTKSEQVIAKSQSSPVEAALNIQTNSSNQNITLNHQVKPVALKQAVNTNKTNNLASKGNSLTFKQKMVNAVAANKIASASKSGASDSDLIIWVILSLFPILALIAIYLHDGKTITLNFWVDLILHLTIVGYFIFALLVVLDIINLA